MWEDIFSLSLGLGVALEDEPFPLCAGAARSSPGVDQAAAGPSDTGGHGSSEGLGTPAPFTGPTGQCEGHSLSPDPGERQERGVLSQEAPGLYSLLVKGT